MRREGLYSINQARICQQVREEAIQRLGAKPGRKTRVMNADAHEELKWELQQKERALVDLSIELAPAKKTNEGSGTDSWSPDLRPN